MTGVPIYSPFPVDPIKPQVAEEISNKIFRGEIQRSSYSTLSLSMEGLIGTRWCNLHCGTFQIIERLEIGYKWQGGKLLPCFPRKYSYYGTKEGPGFWCGERYIIEHWIRVDHWPLAWQLTWFGVELQFHRKMIQLYEAQIASIDANPNIWCGSAALYKRQHQEDMRWQQKELSLAIERMQQFAILHHLKIPFDLLNSGIDQAKRPTQLQLF